jgi:hypothetical protein
MYELRRVVRQNAILADLVPSKTRVWRTISFGKIKKIIK